MAKVVYENINKDSNMRVGSVPLTTCDCPPKRVVKKVYENPDTIKNWVNNRTEELQREIQTIYQEVENIKEGFGGKKLEGKNAIVITNPDASTNRVELQINENDKILSQDSSGLISSLSVSFDPNTHIFNLVGKNGVVVSSCTIPSSGSDPSQGGSSAHITSVEKVVEEGGVFVKFNYSDGYLTKTPIEKFVEIEQNNLGDVTINGVQIKLSDYLKKSDSSSFLTHNDVSTFITRNDISTFITEADASSMFQQKGDYLTEHQHIKTINGQSLIGDGDISIGGGPGILQIQTDWNQSDTTAVDYIKNKPVVISKIKTINGQSLEGEGNIEIGGGGVSVQSDWNQSDNTKPDYIKNKPTVPTKTSELTNDSEFISKVKTINGQSIIGEGNIVIQGGTGSQIPSDWNQTDSTQPDYIKNKPNIPTKTSDITNDSGFLTSHQSIKTINNQVITGEGNINLNTLSDEQMTKLVQLLALNISFSPTTEILNIGGKSYNLGKGSGDLTSRYWIGTINTETRSTFPTLTDEFLIESATEKDVTTLTDGVDVYDVTTNMIYLVIPENINIQKILMGEPPMVTTWQNQEWKDTNVWKQQHTDIVKDDITYHVYGYRAVDMQQTTPTKFQLYLQKQNN